MYKAEEQGRLHGVRVCPSAPSVNHILFADDCLVFCEASVQEVQSLYDVLQCYKLSFSQQVNQDKSGICFGNNVQNGLRNDIMDGIHINQVYSIG